MTAKRTLALFALAFGITLIATAPASLLGAWLGRQTLGALELSSATGTVWQGSAIPVFHSPHGSTLPLGRITWKVLLAPILTGKLELHVSQSTASPAQPTEIAVGLSGVELRHVSLELPAEVAEELHPLLRALHPQGRLEISGDRLALSGQALEGSATAKWLSASSAISTINPFGSYQIRLSGAKDSVALDLTTLSGPLMLSGQGSWTAARGLSIEARATASPGSQDALAELLHHLGPEISPGTRLIRIGQAI